jgi:hypothetical protein
MLRANLSGVLAFDEHVRPLKIVIAPDGRVVAPVMVGMIEAADTVLFLPEESDDALQIQVTLAPFEERGEGGALADRWRIYHGEPPDVRWAVLVLDAARLGEQVFDGDALRQPNALAKQEASLCRVLNEKHTDAVRELCVRRVSKRIENPRVVGVDQDGMDVRGQFEVYRIEAPAPFATETDVLAMLNASHIPG